MRTSPDPTHPPAQVSATTAGIVGTWAVDSRRSTIGLTTKSFWGLITVRGVFRDVSGTCAIAPDGAVSGTITVAAGSIDTGNARRDKHLRSADFLDRDHYPAITFAWETSRPSGQAVVLTGVLTIRTCARPVSFEATASHGEDGAVSLSAEVPINRADFGVTWNLWAWLR